MPLMTPEDHSNWHNSIASWRARTIAIRIPIDYDTTMGKRILHEISILYDEIKPHLTDCTKKLKQVAAYIEITKAENCDGSNDMLRKRSGYEACRSYNLHGEIIDLFELQQELTNCYHDLEGLHSMLDYKREICITMTSYLRTESNLASR